MAERRDPRPSGEGPRQAAASDRTLLGVPAPSGTGGPRATVTGGAAPRTTVSGPEQTRGAMPRPVARPVQGPTKPPAGGSGQAKASN